MVAELAFGDRQVLAGGVALALVAAGQPVEGVQHRPRAVMVAGKHAVAGGGSFEEHLGGTAGCSTRPKARPR